MNLCWMLWSPHMKNFEPFPVLFYHILVVVLSIGIKSLSHWLRWTKLSHHHLMYIYIYIYYLSLTMNSNRRHCGVAKASPLGVPKFVHKKHYYKSQLLIKQRTHHCTFLSKKKRRESFLIFELMFYHFLV